MSELSSVFEPVIGLEVHAELLTRSKMFCGCRVVDSTTAEPNSAVCEICTGMPGTLPVINRRAVEFALRVALALHCEVAPTSVFARKNYFYPDLPKGYQISQYELPMARDGWLEIETEAGPKRIRIRRVHLEEDTGKLFHHADYSLIDYNRSGVPLLEIVSEPDLNAVSEAYTYATALRSLLRYLQVNSGDMEKGVIRFEANVSVRPRGDEAMGTRTEIKNLNSFRAMTRALEYEIQRQSQILARGETVVQETVGWDEDRQATVSQRSKETASDYRYFPEPDLPPLVIDPAWVEKVGAELPELAPEKRARYQELYRLTPYAAALLTAERAVAAFFEAALAAEPETEPTAIANWITGELFSLLNQDGLEIDQSRVTPAALARLVALVEAGRINANGGKAVLAELHQHGEAPETWIDHLGLAQIQDEGEIESLVRRVLDDNPAQVAEFLAGKEAIQHWLFGQVMRATGGRGDPQLIRELLAAALAAEQERTAAE